MFNTTEFIKQKSKELGFLSCGISKAGFLEKEAPKLERCFKEHEAIDEA